MALATGGAGTRIPFDRISKPEACAYGSKAECLCRSSNRAYALLNAKQRVSKG